MSPDRDALDCLADGILRRSYPQPAQSAHLHADPMAAAEQRAEQGPLSAVLYVATDAASTDFTVKLVDVHPDNSCSDVGVDDVVDLYSP